MKLLNCYVENFGNISAKSFDFNNNLICVCEPNGFGKSTLAAFIKAMFYGLPASRSNSKDFDDRQHYYPFSGGTFGGNLTFEKDGKIYKIERVFAKKSAAADVCNYYCNDNRIPVPDSIGREVFGLDEQSFMRTVFIDSADTETGATGGIGAKLNNFVDDTTDGADYDTAMAALDKAKKTYKAAKGGGGKINKCKENIVALENSRRNIEVISAGLGEKYAKREQLLAEIAQTESSLKKASGLNGLLQEWDNYERLLSDAEAAEAEFAKLKTQYPYGLPDGAQLSELNAAATKWADALSRLGGAAFSAQKSARLAELEKTFNGNVPTAESLDGAQSKVIKAAGLVGGEQIKLKSLPEESAVENCRGKLAELREKREQLKNLAPAAASVGAGEKKKVNIPAIIIIFAGVLLIAGGVTMFFNVIAGVIALVVGVCCMCASGFAYFNTKLKVVSAPTGVNGDYVKLQSEISGLENAIKSFLSGYGYFSDGGAEVDFNDFLRDIDIFKRAEERRLQREALESEVRALLNSFGVDCAELQKGVSLLKSLTDEYNMLVRERLACSESEVKTRNIIDGCEAAFKEILSKYRLTADGNLSEAAKRLESDAREYSRLDASRKQLSERAQTYKNGHGLTQKPQGEKFDTAELSEKFSLLNTQLSRIDRSIAEDEAVTEKLQDCKNELENENELLEAYNDKYKVLSLTSEYLERAERNLKDKYVAPVKDKFLKYSQSLEKALGEKVSMDKDFKVYFERCGENRSDRHLSAGQKSLCALCLRLALIDNMYGGDRPFTVMDDPFVNLDKQHMSRAAELLKQISQSGQIIYFCCHESRDIKG